MRAIRPLAALFLAALILGLALRPPRAADAEPQQQRRESECGGLITSTLATTRTLRTCDESEVTVEVEPECPVCPGGLNVVFVQLAKARENRWQNQESAAIVDEVQRYIERSQPESVKLGVIHYDENSTRTVQDLSDDVDRTARAVQQTSNGYVPRGEIVQAAHEAVRMLEEARERRRVADPCEFVVLFAHTKSHDNYREELIDAARQIIRADVSLIVGCPIEPGAWYCQVTPEMPDPRQYHAHYGENGRLARYARQEMQRFPGAVTVRDMRLTQQVPPGLTYVDGSADVEPDEVAVDDEGTQLRWVWSDDMATQPQSVTYRVAPEQLGTFQIEGLLEIFDSRRMQRQVALEGAPVINVAEECVPATVTPNVPPTPTRVPPTPTATATATATATPRPLPIYLPVIVGEECSPEQFYGDVAVVLDMSTSMNHLTAGGNVKLHAVQRAAKLFVRSLDLTADEHGRHAQVAVVGFNAEAWIEQPLTNDVDAIVRAIDRLPERQREFTRLDLALLRGAEALEDARRRDENTAALVLLTDGLPNQVPYAEDGTMETTVLRAANYAKDQNIVVYTIGVGQKKSERGDISDLIDAELLRACASDPSKFYHEPDADQLGAVYDEIGGTLGCGPDSVWPYRRRGGAAP